MFWNLPTFSMMCQHLTNLLILHTNLYYLHQQGKRLGEGIQNENHVQ